MDALGRTWLMSTLFGGGGSGWRVVVSESPTVDFAIRCLIHSRSEMASCEGGESTSIWSSLTLTLFTSFVDVSGCSCGSFAQDGPFPIRGCITFWYSSKSLSAWTGLRSVPLLGFDFFPFLVVEGGRLEMPEGKGSASSFRRLAGRSSLSLIP